MNVKDGGEARRRFDEVFTLLNGAKNKLDLAYYSAIEAQKAVDAQRELMRDVVEGAITWEKPDPENEKAYRRAVDWERIKRRLVDEEFTEDGAAALIAAAQRYGAWFLRHAAVLAEEVGIEDGELGY